MRAATPTSTSESPARPPVQSAAPAFGDAMCMAPFVNLAVAIGGGTSPCCLFLEPLGNVRRQSIPEIWNSEGFSTLRTRLLAEKRDPRCDRCYSTEASGGISLRNRFNKDFARHLERIEQPEPPPPVSLDIRFSNLCNFSCRTCYHGASTKWFSDARKLGWEQGPDALIPSFNSSAEGIEAVVPLLGNVENIYFAGGEPLLHEPHYAILAKLLELGRSDVPLEYNTNFSELEFVGIDVLSLWSKFDHVVVGLSIDGSGRRGELIRKGLDWQQFAANVRALHARCPHVVVRFDITVSVFNVGVLPELCRDLWALGVSGPDMFRFNVLLVPGSYSIQILPAGLKRRIARRLRRFAKTLAERAPDDHLVSAYGSSRAQLAHVVEHMLASDQTGEIVGFRRAVEQLDALRHEKTFDVCPELRSLLVPSFWSKRSGSLRRRLRKWGLLRAGSIAPGPA